MPHDPEFIGKAHEKMTRDILNGDEPQPDTKKMLEEMTKSNRDRVQTGAEKAAEFIKAQTDFEIDYVAEEGDVRKPDPKDDVDLRVVGNDGEEKLFSLKLTSNTAINVRNTLLNKISRDIFGEQLEDLLTSSEYELYQNLVERFANHEIEGSDMGAELIEIFKEKFREFKKEDEEELRKSLLKDMRLDSNMVACKVTSAGNFHGYASTEREAFERFMNNEGELKIYTKESNNTSLFFNLDDEPLFRIDMYGQSQGSTRKPKVKTVYRVEFGSTSHS